MEDAANLVLLITSHRWDRASSHPSDDSEKDSMQLSLERKNGSMKQYYEKMKKLRELVAELREENHKIKQTSKRRRHRAKNSALYKISRVKAEKNIPGLFSTRNKG